MKYELRNLYSDRGTYEVFSPELICPYSNKECSSRCPQFEILKEVDRPIVKLWCCGRLIRIGDDS